jgi:hypothetical protein
MDDPRTEHPQFKHRLGVALQFFDAFAQTTVGIPLRVSIPAMNLVAVAPRAGDDVYRFLLPEPPFPPPPPATVAVFVEGDDYTSHEAILVQLPSMPSAPPPPVLRRDYLVRVPLWPAVSVRVPPGETAVIGHVVSGTPPNVVPAVDYKVVLFTSGETVNSVPYARTDENGDFLYRLSRLKGSVIGNVVTKTATCTAAMFTPADVPVAAVNPASVTFDLGRVLSRQFNLP